MIAFLEWVLSDFWRFAGFRHPAPDSRPGCLRPCRDRNLRGETMTRLAVRQADITRAIRSAEAAGYGRGGASK